MVQILKRHVSQNKHRWGRGIFFAVLFMAIPLIAEYWFVSVAPSGYWFEYIEIEPETQVALPHQVINFLSTATVHQSTGMQWNDILRCERSDGAEYIASTYESSTGASKVGDIYKKEWQYPHGLPADSGTCCWLESTITIDLPFGKTKTQSLLSGKVCIE